MKNLARGGEIQDTKALNMSDNFVTLQILGRYFAIFTLRDQLVAPGHATRIFVGGWGNAERWLVDVLGVDPRQVASLMKNEQQGHHLLLKTDPRSTFRNNVLQPATNIFVARQVDNAKPKNANIDPMGNMRGEFPNIRNHKKPTVNS